MTSAVAGGGGGCQRLTAAMDEGGHWHLTVMMDGRYGASQCGPLNNALKPTLGLKNSFIAIIFRYIPLHTFGANHFYKGGNQKRVRFYFYKHRNRL